MRSEVLTASLPPALLLLFAGWTGTFFGAAGGFGALAGHLALLLCLWAGARRWRDPLGLGPSGDLLLLAALVAIVVSWRMSPVPRAGTLTVLLLPAFLFVPAAVGEWWRTPERRRLGVPMLSLVVAAVAAWSLAEAWRLDGPVALPLGHHNLLAAWLVTLLPVAVTPWRDGGWRRAAALAAAVLGLAALIGTRSLTAAVAMAVVIVAAAARGRKISLRYGLLGLAVAAAVLVPQLPRLARLAEFDSSLAARIGYLEAGWRGLWQRPVFGWGPGATPWTVSEHLRPRPGIHPPDQVVGDLHCLPLQVGYELGLSGFVLFLGLALVLRRRWRSIPADDLRLRRAAVLGLTAFVVMSVGGMPLSVTALPVAALVVLGMAGVPGVRQALPRAVGFREGREVAPSPVAGEGRGEGPGAVAPGGGPVPSPVAGEGQGEGSGAGGLQGGRWPGGGPVPSPVAGEGQGEGLRRWRHTVPSIALAAVVAVLVLPLDLAQIAYDQATVSAGPGEQIRHLRRAVDLDPALPLYRARLAWLEMEASTAADAEAAGRARQAAADAVGVAPLWLVAGEAGLASGAPWSRDALIEACRLNPLGALAPFHLAVATPPGPLSPEWGARAILSEPRLLASPAWEDEHLLVAAVGWASALDGVDEGWRQRLEETFDRGLDTGGETMTLTLGMDAAVDDSLSLHAFRRRPWPVELAAVELDGKALAGVELVSAAGLRTTDPGVLAFRDHCGLADLP